MSLRLGRLLQGLLGLLGTLGRALVVRLLGLVLQGLGRPLGLFRFLGELLLLSPQKLQDGRYEKFRRMGAFVESGDG